MVLRRVTARDRPEASIPPPISTALLALTVELVIVVAALLSIAPPPAPVDALPLNVELVTLSMPVL
jgi:hypothetical protein